METGYLGHVPPNKAQVKDGPNRMAPFNPPLSLRILKGVQAETEWYVGYGPRVIGSNSLEFKILWTQPLECTFELHPSLLGVIIKTQYPEMVRLNGHRVIAKELKDGDVVSINETHIQINFLR